MSCDAVAFSAMLWLASTAPMPSPTATASLDRPAAVASEPLFADIVSRAKSLKSQTEAMRAQAAPGDLAGLPGYAAFKASIAELSDLDMKGHVTLAARGTTDDLKCILKGISQDLPVKLKQLEAADAPKARDQALRELAYLLNDNVEVITAPPTPPA
ncbi:MAG TPA: hypothetical protein VFC47_10025 [Caulobacteraceae bacterium]|nr:hypothetical protein [Caulobacteraceae bacterium]